MRKLLAVIVFLSMVPFSAFSVNLTTFEDGTTEAVVDLEAPGCDEVIRVTLPAECHVRRATMNLSAVLPDSENPDCPESVRILLDDTLLWEFNGTDYGGLGRQDRFAKTTAEWRTPLGPEGGSNGTTIRLPRNATILSATMEVSCNGWAIDQLMNSTGTDYREFLGSYVSGAGDVNGDGFDDVIVGALGNDAGGFDAGRAYIYFGAPAMDNKADVILTGEGDNYFFAVVSGAGDVNGDGFDDVIVGARYGKAGGVKTGLAYLFLGGNNMDTTADVIFTGAAADDRFGCSVSGAGDVNGDGYDDVMVGASDNDAGGGNAGQAYIYLGGRSLDNLSDVVLTGDRGGGYFGESVSGAGDVNQDGYADVIVGAYGSGKAFIYYGGQDMNSLDDLVLAKSSWFGYSVSGAGDVNDDGYDDVIVGYWNSDSASIYFGGTNMDSNEDVTLDGALGDAFGITVSGAGDMNQDGYDDVIVGAYNNDAGGIDAGRAYIFYGREKMNRTADAVLTGAAAGDYFGTMVSDAGDVDGDGYDEIVIGAMCCDAGNNQDVGKAYIFKRYEGIKGLEVSLGAESIRRSTEYLNCTNSTLDFKAKIAQFLQKSNSSGTDKFGNSYVDVPVQVFGKTRGNITLGRLEIVYTLDSPVLDFSDKLNKCIAGHEQEKDANGYLSIPIRVVSRTPGRLELNGLFIEIDEPPGLLMPLPDFELQEDSADSELVDLHRFFEDDYDPKDRLGFRLVCATNASIVNVELSGNRFLSVDALDGSANDNWTGEAEVIVEAADQWGSKRLSNRFRIVVVNQNDPPVMTSEPPTTVAGGQEYVYQVEAVDGDRDPLTFGLARKPGDMTINASTGLVRWLPQKGGKYGVTVTASDGLSTVSQDFSISVPNRSPRLTNSTVPTAYVNEPYVFEIQAEDDDGDQLQFFLLRNVEGMQLDWASGRLTWTPAQLGDCWVPVGISDGTDQLTCNFTIKVMQGNRAPSFITVPVTSGIAGLPYTYDADVGDPDGDRVVFALAEMPEGMGIDNATGRISWTPAKAGNYTVRLDAFDGRGGEGTQEFVIRVVNRTRPKVEFTSPQEYQKVRGKLAVSGRVTKGTLQILSVQLCIDSGGWMNVSVNSTWTHALDTTKLKNGKHTLRARAYDGMDYSDTKDRTITVDNAPQGGKGLIPGFNGCLLLFVFLVMAVLAPRWRHQYREVPR